MAYFAEVDENDIVIRVLAVDDLHEGNGQDFLANTLGLGGTWIQTSYNTHAGIHINGGTPLRKNYAALGGKYDRTLDAFIHPQPYASWVLNTDTCVWEAPVEKPNDNKFYTWDEENLAWEEVILPTE